MDAQQYYDKLDPICWSGLKDSLNSETHVYDLQLMDKEWHNTYEFYPTEDLTSTAICLIGISRAQLDPTNIDLDPQETLAAMNSLAKTRAYPGGFGLVVWANAVWDGLHLNALQEQCAVQLDPIDQHLSTITTMEVSWLASGLAHEYQRNNNEDVRKLLEASTAELIQRRYQPNHQVVAHSGDAAGITHGMRRWIANFADQVYTIQALSFAALITGNEEALNVSDQIAQRMVDFQGEKGQWWWHYDARRGGSPQPYSVYSVHQHGMAPMALRALQSAGGLDHKQAIAMSRNWLYDNELNVSMVDEEQPTIWRSLDYDQGKASDVVRKGKSLLGLAGDQSRSPAPPLKLNYETRPYEWAWCIYAGAIERDIEKGRHIV